VDVAVLTLKDITFPSPVFKITGVVACAGACVGACAGLISRGAMFCRDGLIFDWYMGTFIMLLGVYVFVPCTFIGVCIVLIVLILAGFAGVGLMLILAGFILLIGLMLGFGELILFTTGLMLVLARFMLFIVELTSINVAFMFVLSGFMIHCVLT
jgi:hypothetical protein